MKASPKQLAAQLATDPAAAQAAIWAYLRGHRGDSARAQEARRGALRRAGIRYGNSTWFLAYPDSTDPVPCGRALAGTDNI